MGFYLVGSGDIKYVYYSYSAHDGKVKAAVGMKVSKVSFDAGKLPKDREAVMNRIKVEVARYESNCRLGGHPTSAAVIEKIVADAAGVKPTKKRKERAVEGTPFIDYFRKHLADVESGEILNDGHKYSDSYIKMAYVVLRQWLPNSPIAMKPVDSIVEDDLRAHATYMTNAGLSKNSVASYLDPVESFLAIGRRLKRHSGPVLDSKIFRINREDIDYGIYLTLQEQDSMLRVPLIAEKARWRDGFIFGCQVGLRYSDLKRVAPKYRIGDELYMITDKTNTPVQIPLNELACRLWALHDGVFRLPSKEAMLRLLKDCGRKAGLDQLVIFTRTEGGVPIEYALPRYSLLGTHTARRSMATNAYKAKEGDILSIMSITGHKSTRNFIKYIKMSPKDHAMKLRDNSFFK